MNLLTRRDKQQVQTVTRYSSAQWAHRFTFTVVNGGRILMERPGTTSRAYFRPEDPAKELEFLAELIVFTLRRLHKKHGKDAPSLIDPHIFDYSGQEGKTVFPQQLELWSFLQKYGHGSVSLFPLEKSKVS